VSETLQLEEVRVIELQPEPPQLLVEWTSRWDEFVTSIGPALGRSEARLAGEAPFGLLPYRIAVPTYVLEAFLIFAVIIIPVKLAQMRPYVAPRLSSHDVIYYSGDELPRIEDLGGADAGKTGRAGGKEAHNRTQTIRVARGGSLVPRVVDAPNLKLPSSRDAVANLLAVNPNPGPPPLEGLRSSRSAPNLATTVVAPAPNVTRDFTRNGVRLDGVIAPAPTLPGEQRQTAPNFSATVVPPAPDLQRDHVLVAPALSPTVIPPAPSVSREHTLIAPTLNAQVVAPAPSMTRDRSRAPNALARNVIPPAPASVSREISSAPVQMANAAVVPPPVSAPERASRRNSAATLPAPSVVAPPPSPDMARDLHRLASGNVPDPARTVVPPPPTQNGSGSYVSSLIGRIFGASEVVPPPPTVSSNSTANTVAALPANVVAPPPNVNPGVASGNPRGSRKGMGASLGGNVIAPPPTAGMPGGSGTRSQASSTAPVIGMPSVVPPPPALSGPGGGTGTNAGGNGASSGTLLANNVVPPPPSLGGGANASGSGVGRKGTGLGAPLEAGAPVAPPTAGGSGNKAAIVISSEPGSTVGLPASGANGAMSMSPAGGDKPGLGGAGGGSSIGRGEGTGSGLSEAGNGAGKTGAEHGADPDAHGGISPAPGPGGAGNARGGKPPVPGVDISGGSSQVTLPSFGADAAASDPAAARRSSTKTQAQTLGVTVVATATSGGAFEPYKNLLHGEKYTTYLDTSIGTVVMEFADEGATGHPFGGTLSSPQSIRTALPDGLPRARLMIACTLDASGNLKNVRVLEPGPAEMTAKVVAALRGWKFQPAMRGNQAVEVSAILGFNIDTNDRF